MKKVLIVPAVALLLLSAMVTSYGQPNQAKYVGVDNCKMCHSDKHENWDKTAHARAFDLLVNVEQDKNAECLPCHTTGYGNGGFVDTASTPKLAGVVCEACHGPGGDHNGDKTKITKTPSAAVCAKCHKERNIHKD